MAVILDFQLEWFMLFLIYKWIRYFISSFKSIGLTVQEKMDKTDFQNGSQGDHLWFLILAIFNLQDTLILFIKFQVKMAAIFGFQSEWF